VRENRVSPRADGHDLRAAGCGAEPHHAERRFAFADDIRAVLFDLGNTLMWIDHELLAQTLRGAGLDVAGPAVRAAEMRVRPRIDPVLAGAARREGRETLHAVAELFLDEMGVAPSRRDGPRAAILAGWPTLWRHVPDDVAPSLASLASRGLRLGVVSNTPDGGARRRLAEAGLLERLEFVVDSREVGWEKPDPRIFAHAAGLLGLPPAQCVFVGDYFSIDVLGARGAGMHAVLVDPDGAWGEVDAPRVASIGELAARL
jgi:HAD superfamily hydrolase (TIGR01509 family)